MLRNTQDKVSEYGKPLSRLGEENGRTATIREKTRTRWQRRNDWRTVAKKSVWNGRLKRQHRRDGSGVSAGN
jgi:hypothetical protein